VEEAVEAVGVRGVEVVVRAEPLRRARLRERGLDDRFVDELDPTRHAPICSALGPILNKRAGIRRLASLRGVGLAASLRGPMARVTVEDCLEKEENRFALVVLAAARTRSLMKGAPQLVNVKNKPPVISLREIAAGR